MRGRNQRRLAVCVAFVSVGLRKAAAGVGAIAAATQTRAREWVGVLESLLTSLPHAAQNGCSNGRSLEKITPNLFERTETFRGETA